MKEGAPTGFTDNDQRKEALVSKEEMERLRSRDPYEALGVEYGASYQEIRSARIELTRTFKFSADQGDPVATEALQYINDAFDRVKDRVERNDASAHPPSREPRREEKPSPKVSPERSAGQREVEKGERARRDLLSCLKSGPRYMVQYREKAQREGPDSAFIDGVMKSSEAKDIIRSALKAELDLYARSSGEHCAEFVNEWIKAGVDMRPFLEDPIVKNVLEKNAIDAMTYFKASGFRDYLAQCKKFGVDMAYAAELPRAQKFFEEEFIGTGIRLFGVVGPSRFRELVESWKGLGVDASRYLNSAKACDLLLQMALDKGRLYSKDNAKAFLADWKKVGWKLSSDIILKLQKAGIEP